MRGIGGGAGDGLDDEGRWLPYPLDELQEYLPAGRYDVLGMTAWSTNSEVVAARLLLPNQVYRPGALVLPSGRTIPPAFELDGSFGVWGWFEQEQPPQLEVFGLSGVEVTISGYVKIVRASAQSSRAGGVA